MDPAQLNLALLPTELIYNIYGSLEDEDLCTMKLVNKVFENLTTIFIWGKIAKRWHLKIENMENVKAEVLSLIRRMNTVGLAIFPSALKDDNPVKQNQLVQQAIERWDEKRESPDNLELYEKDLELFEEELKSEDSTALKAIQPINEDFSLKKDWEIETMNLALPWKNCVYIHPEDLDVSNHKYCLLENDFYDFSQGVIREKKLILTVQKNDKISRGKIGLSPSQKTSLHVIQSVGVTFLKDISLLLNAVKEIRKTGK